MIQWKITAGRSGGVVALYIYIFFFFLIICEDKTV